MANPKAIIPCAGYGTRMGLQPHQSKEMLTDPNDKSKYLIDYALDLCYSNNIDPIVISRQGKDELNDYLKPYKLDLIILKEPGKEWAETVLKSQGLWGDKNILILPDTRFQPETIIPDIIKSTNCYSSIVVGWHEIKPEDSHKWGTVNSYGIYEKQGTLFNKAWGILGFTKFSGQELFQSLKPEGTFQFHQIDECSPEFRKLNNFKDITRSGTLEKY